MSDSKRGGKRNKEGSVHPVNQVDDMTRHDIT